MGASATRAYGAISRLSVLVEVHSETTILNPATILVLETLLASQWQIFGLADSAAEMVFLLNS
jgi:hypothetical protein